MILLIDNYDSFTYNLVQQVGGIVHDLYDDELELKVIRNDELTSEEIMNLAPSHIILSPGPGRPRDAGITEEVIRSMKGRIPILGVCLGHQAIGECFGGTITYAKEIVHGKKRKITVNNTHPFFLGLPETFYVGRYHSLAIEDKNIPEELEVISRCEDGEIMAVAHKEYPILGIQFHPESFLTEYGNEIIRNFLSIYS